MKDNLVLSTELIKKPNYLELLPADAAPQFLNRNLPPLSNCDINPLCLGFASFITKNNKPTFCFRLVESDATTQEEVSKMSALIDKILFMVDRRQSEPADYSLFSSQVASNTLFYCTFNVKSAWSLVECGALTKAIDITRHLLFDKEGNTPLRYLRNLNRLIATSQVKFTFLGLKN